MAGDDARHFSRSFSVRNNYRRANTLHSYRTYKYLVPENVHSWRKSLLTTYVEEDEKQQDFSNLGHIQELQRPRPFPAPAEDDNDALILRKTLDRRNVVARSQTIHVPSGHPLPGSLKRDSTLPKEIKNVLKIRIDGEEKPCKGHSLRIENGKILLVEDKSGKVLISRENFTPSSHRLLDEKTMELKSSIGEVVELKFAHSKDTEHYCMRKRANSESRPPDSPSEDKKKTRNILMKFLKRRSSKDVLVRKGILKNEPIFGNSLNSLWESYEVEVPQFITKVIDIIERPYNITSLGIYRASGNLATIQKIRLNVDKNNLKILEEYRKDTDVLTGCLKMFFRELNQPLIPIEVYEYLLKLAEKKWTDDIPETVFPVIENMEKPHRETLKTLMVHLLKVIDNQGENKMSMQNMSIVWGPSLIHVPDSTGENLIQNSNNANSVIFLLLKCFTFQKTPLLNDEQHDPPQEYKEKEEEVVVPLAPKASQEVYHSLEDLTKAENQAERSENFVQASQKIGIFLQNDILKKNSYYASNMSLASTISNDGASIHKGYSNYDISMRIKLMDLPQSSKSRIPKFFVKVVGLIEKHLKSNILYTRPNKEEKVEKIKLKIRQGRAYSLSKIKSSPSELCQLLLDFLDQIIEPLLPKEAVDIFLDDFDSVNDQQRQLDMQLLIEKLDNVHKETIEFLMKHLNIVVDCQEHNNLTKERICEIFAPRFFIFSQIDPKRPKYEKIFESIFNIYVSHSPSPELGNSAFGSSRSITSKSKEFQFPESPKQTIPRFKTVAMKDKFKRLSKFHNVKSVYDNLPVQEGVYIQNEATFLDDNT